VELDWKTVAATTSMHVVLPDWPSWVVPHNACQHVTAAIMTSATVIGD